MTSQAKLTVDGPIARITFHTENGVHILGREMRHQLSSLVDELHHNNDVRVVVFAAQGRTFCAGADLQELRSQTTETARELAVEGQMLMQRIADLPQVTIAAVHAACAGGGCELALACDLRFGANSSRIGLPETSIGIIPGWGGSVRTTRLLGIAAARRIVLSAELWPAEEALRFGLYHAVFADEEFEQAIENEIQKLLTRGPTALKEAKSLLEKLPGDDLRIGLAAEADAFVRCYSSGEPQEGINAFLEKRQPVW